MDEKMTQKQQLENLLLTEDLEELNNLTNQFNVFKALKLHNIEIRHSNFLSWLLSAGENHNIGDYFLKEFLKNALARYRNNEQIDVKLHDVVFEDFSDVEIRREYHNIDILITSPKNKFLCVIENKIWSTEHDDQLNRYAESVNDDNEFLDYNKKLFIFLTPTSNISTEPIIRGNQLYIQMDYNQVAKAVERVLKYKKKLLTPDVIMFISHYLAILKNDIVKEKNELEYKLRKEILLNHEQAVNVVIYNNYDLSENEAVLDNNSNIKVLSRKMYNTYKHAFNRLLQYKQNIKEENDLKIFEILKGIVREDKIYKHNEKYAFVIRTDFDILRQIDYTAYNGINICFYAGLDTWRSRNLADYFDKNRDLVDKFNKLIHQENWSGSFSLRVNYQGNASCMTQLKCINNIEAQKIFVDYFAKHKDLIGLKDTKTIINTISELASNDVFEKTELTTDKISQYKNGCLLPTFTLSYNLSTLEVYNQQSIAKIFIEKTMEGLKLIGQDEVFKTEFLKSETIINS